VKPVSQAPTPRVGDGFDLLSGANLTTLQTAGEARQKPKSLTPADGFSVRFKGQQD
jgi:hypothetical protein